MKKLLYTLLICCFSGIAFSQAEKVYTTEEVARVPIMKGCDASNNDSAKATRCLSLKFNEEISNELFDNLINFDEFSNFKQLEAKISFVVTKFGLIEILDIESTNKTKFAQKVKIAMLRIANKVNKNNPLEPAKLEDGTPVNLKLSLPVTLYFSH